MPEDGRIADLGRRLVHRDTVVIHPLLEPDAFNMGTGENFALLAPPRTMADDVGNQTVAKAQEVYYGSKRFLVWWDMLEEFLGISSGSDKTGSKVARMVRNITIRYDLRELARHQRNLATEMMHLFQFLDAKSVVVEIVGEGTPDGSDPATQEVFREISVVVAILIEFLGRHFTIRKLKRGLALEPAKEWMNLRSYWDPPTESAIARWDSGEASFEESMQVQVQRWIREAAESNAIGIPCGEDEFGAAGGERDVSATNEQPTVNCAMLERKSGFMEDMGY